MFQKKGKKRERIDSLPSDFSPMGVSTGSGSVSGSSRAYSYSNSDSNIRDRKDKSYLYMLSQRSPSFMGKSPGSALQRVMDYSKNASLTKLLLAVLAVGLVMLVFAKLADGNKSLKDISMTGASTGNFRSSASHIFRIIKDMDKPSNGKQGDSKLMNFNLTDLGKETKTLVETLVDVKFSTMQKRVDSLIAELNASKHRVSSLEDELKLSQKELQSLKNEKHTLPYDTSDVGSAVLQNLEEFSVKEKIPWVLPCGWEGCRSSNLSSVLIHITKRYLTDHKDRKKINVVQLGGCSINVTGEFFNRFSDSVDRFTLIDEWKAGSPASNKQCRGVDKGNNDIRVLMDGGDAFSRRLSQEKRQWRSTGAMKNEIKLLKNMYPTLEIMQTDEAAALPKFKPKSVDILFIDHQNEAVDPHLKKTLERWIPKVISRGIVLGHSYGVQKPSNPNKGLVTRWNGKELLIEPKELSATKLAIDNFVRDKNENFVNSVRVTGDTGWYMQKKKIRLSDLFNN